MHPTYYPEPCRGNLLGYLLGHDFPERGFAEKQLTCNRCGFCVPVAVDHEVELAIEQEETRRLHAEAIVIEAEEHYITQLKKLPLHRRP